MDVPRFDLNATAYSGWHEEKDEKKRRREKKVC